MGQHGGPIHARAVRSDARGFPRDVSAQRPRRTNTTPRNPNGERPRAQLTRARRDMSPRPRSRRRARPLLLPRRAPLPPPPRAQPTRRRRRGASLVVTTDACWSLEVSPPPPPRRVHRRDALRRGDRRSSRPRCSCVFGSMQLVDASLWWNDGHAALGLPGATRGTAFPPGSGWRSYA